MARIMLQCKNADEYWKELWRLRREGLNKYYSEVTKLQSVFDAIEDPTRQDYENIDRDENKLLRKCLTEAEDFEKYHFPQPLYVYKNQRQFYEVRYIQEYPFLWVSSKPIDKQTIREKSNAWVLPLDFSGKAVAVVSCLNCKRPFIRTYPNEKFCFRCKKLQGVIISPTSDDKRRYCQNPECGKEIPPDRHGKAKYCKGGSCRQAAYRKRKGDQFPF